MKMILKINFVSCVFALISEVLNVSSAQRIDFISQPAHKIINKGDPLMLNCMVGEYIDNDIHNAMPLASNVTWYKDGIPLSFSGIFGVKTKFLNGSMLISRTFYHNENNTDSGEYYCIATYQSTILRSLEAKVSFAVFGRFIKQPQSASKYTEESHHFSCQFADTSPSPLIEWFKDNTKIGNNLDYDSQCGGNTTRVLVLPSGDLEIRGIKIEDEGLYFCMGSNLVKDKQSRDVNLRVKSGSVDEKTSLTISKPVNKSAVVGDTTYFSCLFDGYPISPVVWYKNGVELDISSQCNKYTQVGQGTIIIMDITISDEAMYSCKMGDSHMYSSYLHVSAPPYLTGNHSYFNYATYNDDFKLFCNVSGLPTPQVKWFKNGRALSNINTEGNSLIFTKVRYPDGGIYQCIASNKVGTVQQSLFVAILDQSLTATGVVKGFTVDPLSSTTIAITWDDSVNLYDRKYQVVMQEMLAPKKFSKIIELDESYKVFKGLKKYSKYGFRIAVRFNNNGGQVLGPFTEQIIVRTNEDVPDQPPSNISVKMADSSSALLTWQPPPTYSINGVLTLYKIRYKTSNQKKSSIVTLPSDTLKYKLTGLSEGKEYTIKLQAATSVGAGALSKKYHVYLVKERSQLSDSRPPGKPRLQAIQRFSTELLINWLPPTDGSVVKEYIVSWGRKTPQDSTRRVGGKTKVYRITGLQPSVKYFVGLRASNDAGLGMQDLEAGRTKSSHDVLQELYPPLGVHIDVLTSTTLNVSWHDSRKKSASRYYVIRYKTNVPSEPKVQHLNSSEPSCLIHSLRPHTQYEVAIRVLQGTRQSSWSMTETAMTLQDKPGSAPTDLTVHGLEGDLTSVQLNWQPPNKPNGVLNGYLIFYTTNAKHDISKWVIEPVLDDQLSVRIERLTSDTQYYFKALARNPLGVGPYSEVVEFHTQSREEVKGEPVVWSMQSWMWYVVIGGVALLVIIVVSIATLIICRNRKSSISHKKRKSQLTSSSKNIGMQKLNTSMLLPSNEHHRWGNGSRSVHSGQSLLNHDLSHAELLDEKYHRAPHSSVIMDYRYHHPMYNQDRMHNLNGIPHSHTRESGRYMASDLFISSSHPCSHSLFSSQEQHASPHIGYPQDYTGDSAYGSDHPTLMPADGSPRPKIHQVQLQDPQYGYKYNSKEQDSTFGGSSSSTPPSGASRSLKDSSTSLATDEINDALFDVLDVVRSTKEQVYES